MSIQDIVVLVLLLLGILIGLTQTAPKKMFRVLIVVVVIVLVYYVFVPILTDWICYKTIEVFGYEEIEFTIADEVVYATTIEELFTSLDYFGIDKQVLSAQAVTFCEIISFIVLLPVAIFVSLIISGLLWHLLIKRFLPEKLKKGGTISHIIGGLLGGIEMLVIILLLAVSLAQLSISFEDSILKTINDETSSLYSLYGVLNGTDFQSLAETIERYIEYFSPTNDANTILPALLNMLSSMNINYLGMFKTIALENGEQVEVNFADGFTASLNEVIDYLANQVV